MHEFLWVITFVMALGLLTYGLVLLVLQRDESEAGDIKDMLHTIQNANPGVKIMFIFILGGTVLSEIVVKVINAPFIPFDNKNKKKSA